MSKQYLAEHTIDDAHRIDIYSLAVAPTQIISASGESSLKVHSTKEADFPIAQVLKNAHKLGCHHVVASQNGRRAASVGFGGEAKIWRYDEGMWKEDGEIAEAPKAGELWAVTLSAEGRYLAGTTYNGRINVWDLDDGKKKFREYETKGSFGMSIDLVISRSLKSNPLHLLIPSQSVDGSFTASGHESGNVYVFSNDTSRLLHSLPGLVKPIRAVAFSPGGKLLAAAGDARIIALYDFVSGEQVANLTGHSAWITSLHWSHTGEYLLSG
jgi:superkiller protein 8